MLPSDPPPGNARQADLYSRYASLAMAVSLPADTVLYLLLPAFAAQFGVSLAEAGILLAANRLVRIAGYGWVTRFYARHGDRPTCTLAAGFAALCALGNATLSGFWLLLPIRLVWGLCFAALNLATQSLATAVPAGAAARSGRSRAIMAMGPMLALPAGAALAQSYGPRAIFFLLAGIALFGLLITRKLPAQPHAIATHSKRLRLPNSLDIWSFLEGFTLDGLFIIGLSYLGRELLPGGAVMAAGLLLALRYASEIVLSPLGGRMADKLGAVPMLVVLSLLTAAALVGFGLGWLWSCAALIVVLRALQLPLLAPIVAQRTPGPERVHALASRAVWRDIGAGIGPMAAGLLLPVAAPVWVYGVPALLLAAAALGCVKKPVPPAAQ
jgi:DHA1 family inner membrane transport protein